MKTLVAIPKKLACERSKRIGGEFVSWSDPHISSVIVIKYMNIMRIIRIEIQMIAKAKRWIILYKDFVVSHSASPEYKQQI